jgi:hypothetical protein
VRDAEKWFRRAAVELAIAGKHGESYAYVVPFGPDYSTAIAFGDHLIAKLRAQGLQVQVETRRAHNGLALLLTDVTP